MSVTRIATRYAKSLIDLAQDGQKLEKVREDIEAFQTVCKNRDFYLFLKSPIIKGSKKLQVMNALFGGSTDILTQAFFRIIILKGRESYLPEIAAEFIHQYRTLMHIDLVRLTFAEPVSDATLNAMRQQISTQLGNDGRLDLEVKTDPSIIGGFILQKDDKLIDASVRHRLSEIKKSFLKKI